MVDSLKLSWIKRLLSPDPGKWKCIPLFYMHPIEYTICMSKVNLEEHTSLNKLPIFYRNFIDTCIRYNNIQEVQPHCICEVKMQRIWENKNIIVNNKSLFNKLWIDSNIKIIGDIIVNDRIKKVNEITPCLSKTHDVIIEYTKLIVAIPNSWRSIIKHNPYCLTHKENECTTNYDTI